MKNFRKVLALVLVIATLFSFAAMAGAKSLADYEDADKVSYEYAVSVLSAVGVLNGYEDDTFKPTNTISREEMAKMIAVMANATDDISDLYAAANTFADVEADRWSASYISYCAHTGIVAGRSATTFDPYGKVTGLETAKMLLVVMGLDAEAQGYVGANWKVNVLRDAKNMGLLNYFAADYDIDAAITREEAAQMMLNALLGNVVVGVVNDEIVNVTNAVYNAWHGRLWADLIDSDKQFGNVKLYGNVIVSATPVHVALYGSDLEMSVVQDCFKRDTAWFKYTVKGITVAEGRYALGADATYTTFVDVDTAYKAQKDANYTLTLVSNGEVVPTATWTNAETFTGNGVDTAIYVTAPTATTPGNVEVNVIKNYIDQVASVSKYTGKFTTDNTTGSYTVVADVAVDDFIIFRPCYADNHTAIYGASKTENLGAGVWGGHYAMHDYEVVKPATVKVDYARHYVNGTDLHDCFFKTTEGTSYKYDETYGVLYNNEVAVDAPAAGDTVNIYLDKYGYVMLITEPEAAAATVAYIEEKSDALYTISADAWGTVKQGVTLDAAIYTGAAAENVALTEIKTAYNPDSNLLAWYKQLLKADKTGTGSLVAYTVDPITGLATMTASAGYVTNQGAISATTQNVQSNGETYGLTDETVFMIRSTNPVDGTWTYEEVVGRKNLTETYALTNYTYAQVLELDGDSYADYVFIDAKFVKVASEFFVLGREYMADWTGIAGLTTQDYVAFRALVNGAESLVLFTEAEAAAINAGGLYTGAVAYKGVTMVEDQSLNLYVSASTEGYDTVLGLDIAKVDVTVIGADVWVELKDTTPNGNGQEVAGVEKLPVYHIVKKGTLNDNLGYWTEYNEIDGTLKAGAATVYVVRNAAEKITALYVVATDWNA